MLFRTSVFIIFFCSLVNTSFATEQQPGFDEICNIYTEIKNSNMTQEQKEDYIFDNIEKRVQQQGAKDAYSASVIVDPNKRYDLLKESAEMVVKHKWDCPAMQEFMNQLAKGSK